MFYFMNHMFEKDAHRPVMTEAMIDFAIDLYKEHLEEASFLYEQRLSLFDDPEVTWLALLRQKSVPSKI